MRALLGGNSGESVRMIRETLNNGVSGCCIAAECGLGELADDVARYRPDLVIVDMSCDVEAALAAIGEAQEAHPLRVVAVGPSSDAKLILRTLNEGVDKYVDLASVNQDLPSALRRLGPTPRSQGLRGRVIAVVGVSGGSGATTLTANIGAALASRDKRTVLIDLDLEAGDLAPMLGAQGTHSIADFCQNLNRMDSTMLNKCLAECRKDLLVMAAPNQYQKISLVTPRGVRRAVNMIRQQATYVVVDVPCTYRPVQSQALFAADIIVLAVRPEYTSVRQASRVLAYFEDVGISLERIRIVVTRRVGRLGLRDADIEASLHTPVHAVVPEHPKHMTAAANRGVPLVVDRPRSPVSHRLTRLAASVNGVIETDVVQKEAV